MPEMRGYFFSNVAIGFALCVGGIVLADALTYFWLPDTARHIVYWFALAVCLSPFACFVWWARADNVPSLKQCVFWAVWTAGLAWINLLLLHFGLLNYVALVIVTWSVSIYLWQTVFTRWVRSARK